MATATLQEALPVQHGKLLDDQNDVGPQRLRDLCTALGMEHAPANELQKPDVNFLLEMAKLPTDLTKVPSGTDVVAMRHWINEVFLKDPIAEWRTKCDISRRRARALVNKSNVSVTCLDSSQDSFGIRVYEPSIEGAEARTQKRPAMLMYHGGGWIHGTPQGDEGLSEIFASELNAVVFSVDYRLAPEYPFPAPLDDCCQAVQWVLSKSSEYNIDTDRIGLWGASAGGNLAAAVALRMSQPQNSHQTHRLRLVSLVAPATAHPKAEALFHKQRKFGMSQNEEAFRDIPPPPADFAKGFGTLLELYAQPPTDPCHPFVSPLLANPSTQHPSTHVTVTACDHLRTQGLAYAQLLRSSGVNVMEEVLPGVPHGFTFPMNADVTRKWVERQIDIFMSAFEE